MGMLTAMMTARPSESQRCRLYKARDLSMVLVTGFPNLDHVHWQSLSSEANVRNSASIHLLAIGR